jgi:alkylation response protein AidB-like acyl-CoA dehydrogenase
MVVLIEFPPELEDFKREVARTFTDLQRPEWLSLDPESDEYLALGREMDLALIERNWYALHWPREYGGAGDVGSFLRHAALRELEGYFRVPTYGGHGRYIVGPALIEFGSAEQKERYLPPVARGETVICLGFTEPDAGSDLAAMQLRAVRDGDHYIANGSKLYITYGHYATSMLLAARTDPKSRRHDGVSLFLMDMNLPGITVNHLPCLTGHMVTEVHLENVRIPAGALLGEAGRGFYHMAVALNYERSGLDWPAKYMAQLEDVADYARETGLWRRASIHEAVGRLAAQLEAWRMICWRVVMLQARGEAPSWEASMAQLYRKDFNPQFGRLLLEVVGPQALVERGESRSVLAGRVEWYLRESFNNHGQGGRFVTRNVIARRGLALPRM